MEILREIKSLQEIVQRLNVNIKEIEKQITIMSKCEFEEDLRSAVKTLWNQSRELLNGINIFQETLATLKEKLEETKKFYIERPSYIGIGRVSEKGDERMTEEEVTIRAAGGVFTRCTPEEFSERFGKYLEAHWDEIAEGIRERKKKNKSH